MDDDIGTVGRDLFFLAVLLVVAAYYVGFSTEVSAVTNAVSYVGRLFSGQIQPAAKTA